MNSTTDRQPLPGKLPFTHHLYEALTNAAIAGDLDCIKSIIGNLDARHKNSEALGFAAEFGHLDCVLFLLPHSEPKDFNSEALRKAAQKGHIQIIDILLPFASPEDIAFALSQSISAGNKNSVDHLLKKGADPRLRDSHALFQSARSGNRELTERLSKICDVELTKTRLKESGLGEAAWLIDSVMEEEKLRLKHGTFKPAHKGL